jgi:predicted transcriptional regulator
MGVLRPRQGTLTAMTATKTRTAELLGPLERRVMDALWRLGPSSARQILDVLNRDADRPLAYTTVMTILVRLHEKGYATREPRGRGFEYSAAVGPDELADAAGRRELERLIERYGAPAVARFAEDLERENPDLVRRLRALAEGEGKTG